MPPEQEVQAKPLPSDLANSIHRAARDLWLFVNSEYREGDGASLAVVALYEIVRPLFSLFKELRPHEIRDCV